MRYRLGLDLGTNSIGWCAIKLDEAGTLFGILDAGVRILTPNEEAGRDPKSKVSLAANRRGARATRRRRDRFLRRQKRLMELLVQAELMPADEVERKALEQLDPYWLRAAALDRRLEPHELGRALFHLNQRRGFKSNRIAEDGDGEESALKAGITALHQALERSNARTLGELLARRHRRDRQGRRLRDGQHWTKPEAVRFRPQAAGRQNLYDFYPSRDLVEAELDCIWAAQQHYHPALTDQFLDRLRRVIIGQRELKKPIVGRCTLRPEASITRAYGFDVDMGERAPRAHPLFQRFRILQEVSQLRIARPGRPERWLTLQEREAITAVLMQKGGNLIEFEKLRSAARLSDDCRFNYELSGRKGLQPDQTAVKLSVRKAFGPAWRSFPRMLQVEVVERLLATEEEDELIDWLRQALGLDEEKAQFISALRLPQMHGHFGRSVLADLVSVMESRSREVQDPETGEILLRPLTYDEAVRELDLHHSNLRPDHKLPELPYYGEVMVRHVICQPNAPEGSQERIGRVPNPTVHIGLNQVRKLVNRLIEVYGPPEEIVVELARELKLNAQRKAEVQRQNRENERLNEARRALLARLGVADSHEARLRLRLFEELPAEEKVCVFTGTPISVERLFDGSIEIEHLLPYSSTLDDSFMNKALCTREANRRKGRRAPADAWTGTELQEIVERAERLFPRKAWRFQPDAMTRFETEGGFLARQLTDTQHMARLAKAYLEQVCGQVWAPPGRLTAMLRAKWGLDSLLSDHNYADTNQAKNRRDHRHHAIDAFVIACTDRGLLNRIARASGRAEDLNLDRLFPKDSFPEPYPGFRDDLGARLAKIIVSHKPDHGLVPGRQRKSGSTSGRLHEDTAYGIVNEEIDGKRYNLVTRKPIDSLTIGEIERVRDAALRKELKEVAAEAQRDGRKLSEALAEFARAQGIRRVRLLKGEKSVRIVRHGDGFHKAYVPGENHSIEIYELPDGRWAGKGVTVFDANQPSRSAWQQEYPGARLVMRLHKGDAFEADFGGGRLVYIVRKLSPANKRIEFVPHFQAGRSEEAGYLQAAYSKLKTAGARRIRIDPIGGVTSIDARP